ncbi:MAG: tyrosine-type recombinase/integrase [Clostridiales bacterium]|jgi:site-specific recombinase XerD|nr:tyrosine-type recombinase/integrase [Clostridiales bacterium]
MKAGYFDERNEKTIEKIRAVCKTLPPYVAEFVVGVQMRTSALTRLGYVSDIKTFLEYLLAEKFTQYTDMRAIPLSALETLEAYDFELYLDYLSAYTRNGKKYRCGAHSKERKLAGLRTFFKHLYKRDRIAANVTEKVDMPKVHDKPILYLEVNEIADLLDMAESGALPGSERRQRYAQKTRLRDLAILTLFLGTGVRISELVGLDTGDLDLKANAVNITRKGGNKSVVYFSDEVRAALKGYLAFRDGEQTADTPLGRAIAETSALFISLKGNRISVRAVELLVKKYAAAVTPLKKITPHKLRSTYGTTLYRETQDIYVVADVLGHNDVNTTKKHYAAVSDEIRRGAANAVRLRDKRDEK